MPLPTLVSMTSRKCLPFLKFGLAWGGLLVTIVACGKPAEVTLSSGVQGGYYSRLSQQISESATSEVQLTIRNRDSQGSRQNLERLINREVDFALVQLDVASETMRQGKVKAVALLANENLHVITRRGTKLGSFADLQNKRLAVGAPGSGTRFTADNLIAAAKLNVIRDESGFDQAIARLQKRQVDAVFYVGSLGASESLRQQFAGNSTFQIAQLPVSLVNYLTVRDPGSYQAATIPLGTYSSRPAIPDRDVRTLSTATALVTRPDVSDARVGLITWAILSNSRQYSLFYPELQGGEAKDLLQKGLFYIHPAAAAVYEQGDPRNAWIRYWESNSDLQAGLFIVLGTSGIGLLLQYWRKERAKKVVSIALKRIADLKTLLPHNANQALQGIEDLHQEHRLMFIDGALNGEVYDQVRHKTEMFAVQCRTLLEEQRKQFILNTLLLLDDWQATLQTQPELALQKMSQLKQQYRDMLLAGEVDIEAYIELMELTLMSVMTLAPKNYPASLSVIAFGDSEARNQEPGEGSVSGATPVKTLPDPPELGHPERV